MTELTEVADYVVIGAGSAGSAIARRLVDAGHSVHVIEAGSVDSDPNIHSPQGWPGLLMSPNDWAVMTTPQEHLDGRVLYWPRGKTLGGSSSLNGMIYMRGDRRDYDGWAAQGASGWSWDDVLPYFRKSEDHADGADDFHGAGGPLHVERIPVDRRHPLATAFVEASVSSGIPRTEDFNRDSLDGAGFNHTTTKDGKRASAWQSFVAPILGHEALAVTTNALVDRIVVDAGRAVGVEYEVDGVRRLAKARREIVLSGGAIGSPAVLLRSGIGPRGDLEQLGIEVVADVPGVGEKPARPPAGQRAVRGPRPGGPAAVEPAREPAVRAFPHRERLRCTRPPAALHPCAVSDGWGSGTRAGLHDHGGDRPAALARQRPSVIGRAVGGAPRRSAGVRR
ncbi:GMC family oxidoreductase [Microbacterium phyllosphaerae]|uniref:GMC family oxidoreductase n=1 Tax=Microbacterium phyllosphaerae TaxID=124798 RepID=UPI00216A70A2|nr:GMC family oxidoreductase N-terminal domain-containing protein [Microbacterium phyllosphaerae]MCS3441984.1 choline dehydrogenase-like flavoprotein [Microbacterium phyllosphaerae]